MAKFKQITFYIDRSSYPVGSVCSIHYEYFLSFDAEEINAATPFHVYCELWGINVIREKRLTQDQYDVHEFEAKHSIDLARAFVVPCDLLNEKLGEDYLFIKLKLVKDGVIIDEIKSDEVHDSF